MAYKFPGYSCYGYANSNPVSFNDPSGLLTAAQFWSIVDALLSSEHGGYWQGGGSGSSGTMGYYGSGNEALEAGIDYVDHTSGWSYTMTGNEGETRGAYQAIRTAQATGERVLYRNWPSHTEGVYGFQYTFVQLDKDGNWYIPYTDQTYDPRDGALQGGPELEMMGLGVPEALGANRDDGENLDRFFNGAAGVIGAFETGSAIGTLQSLRTITFSTAKTALKVTKGLRAVGSILSVAGVGYNVFSTGQIRGSDITTLVTTGVLIGAGVILGTAAAPFLAAGAVVIGIATLVGQDWLDDSIGTYTIFDKTDSE